MRSLLILVASLLIILFPSGIEAQTTSVPDVRILLHQGISTLELEVTEGSYVLVDCAYGLTVGRIASGEKWSIRKEGLNYRLVREEQLVDIPVKGPLLLQAEDASVRNLFRYRNLRYRGDLYIYNEPSGLVAVNVLDLENYLASVMVKEMGVAAPLEALKAQAVVSRTYALSNRNPSAYYDLTADTATQVYGGYEAEVVPGVERIYEAVRATEGQVIYYDSNLIQAFFHANGGGHTENSENIWEKELPYLKGVSSPYDVYALEYPKQSPDGWPGDTYHWQQSFTRQELEKKIQSWNQSHPEDQIRIGELLKISTSNEDRRGFPNVTPSGRVSRLDLIGTGGTKSFFRDKIRLILGLKSTLFQVISDEMVFVTNGEGQVVPLHSVDAVKIVTAGGSVLQPDTSSTHLVGAGSLTRSVFPRGFEKITFQGWGHGHGVGMSQWGAWGMAEAGYNYQQIIEHYYNQGKNDGRLTIGPI
ncbi:MAG TPA: SpoIID/LytB domain-containing protein [Clostridia bacterium]|nr:SpoIID/LytB domain-containing protein [Clostridia bacterium]